MKVWDSFGSEHSSRLVMIGTFKTTAEAKTVELLIDRLKGKFQDTVEIETDHQRYSPEVLEILRKEGVYNLSPNELKQFLFDSRLEVEENKLILRSEEDEVSAFVKVMLHYGAKMEIYSTHDYPESE